MKNIRLQRVAVCFLLFSQLLLGRAFAWDENSHENVLVFGIDGEVVSSYNLENWSTKVNSGSVTHEVWSTGQPPTNTGSSSTSISYSGGDVVVPNMINGSSTIPPGNIPSVSLYSFDNAIFSSTTPTSPGLSVSPSPDSIYNHTIAVEIRASKWPGASVLGRLYVEVFDPASSNWRRYPTPHTEYIYQDRILKVRSNFRKTGTFTNKYSPEYIYNYTIKHAADWSGDSDSDGFPDAWEVAHGFDPLGIESLKNQQDSDGDGINDIDEILRGSDPANLASTPLDTDGDGWSDWDENIRGTLIDDNSSLPTANRLYEVEIIIDGTAYKSATPASFISNANTEIVDFYGNILHTAPQNINGNYGPARIPMGREAVVRSSAPGSQAGLTVKRFLPSIADLSPRDMAPFTWTTPAQWQAHYINFLQANLVQTINGFDVQPSDMPQVALMERSLEILAGKPAGEWYSFGIFGHEPDTGIVDDLADRLTVSRDRSNSELGVLLPKRSINDFADDIALALLQTCVPISSSVNNIYTILAGPDSAEELVSLQLQGPSETYIAGILLNYSFISLANETSGLCATLDANGDLDGDGIKNGAEGPSPDHIAGLSDPFHYDTDLDGISDLIDNCPRVVNPAQHDWDADGMGDACDSDNDNDGLDNGTELVFGSSPFNADTDADGTSDKDEWLAKTSPGVQVYFTDYTTPTNVNTQTVYGVRFAGAAVSVSIDGGASTGIVSYPTLTTWSVLLSGMSADTTYNVNAAAIFGPKRGYAHISIVTDYTNPVITIVSPVAGTVYGYNNPNLEFNINESVLYSNVYLDGAVIATNSGAALGPLSEGNHLIRVEAADLIGNTAFAESSFTIDANIPPVADAGPDQNVEPGGVVVLSAANSYDLDDTIGSYLWSQTAGTPVTISDPTAAQPTFVNLSSVAPGGEALQFDVLVTDGAGESGSDSCIVNVTSTNIPPVAEAGSDQDVSAGVLVTLNGSMSIDSDSASISHFWNQLSGPPVTLSDSTAEMPSFIAPTLTGADSETLVFELMVEDTEGLLAVDQTIVNIIKLNNSPTASAGTDLVAAYFDFLTLDGSASTDPDGSVDGYHWSQMTGEPVTLSLSTDIQPNFSAPLSGINGQVLKFRLTVTDNGGLDAKDEKSITLYMIDYDNNGVIDGSDLARMAAESLLTNEQIQLFLTRFGR